MTTIDFLVGAAAGRMGFGIVLTDPVDASTAVRFPDALFEDTTCVVLQTSDANRLTLVRGDQVLAWVPEDQSGVGVILGRIGPSHAPAASEGTDADVPDELVIEAKQQLTLRVGDGSITLRADGKIQIKGKDLVSHAQRLNRIKGGAVSIN
jgi:hypothetical protein